MDVSDVIRPCPCPPVRPGLDPARIAARQVAGHHVVLWCGARCPGRLGEALVHWPDCVALLHRAAGPVQGRCFAAGGGAKGIDWPQTTVVDIDVVLGRRAAR